MRRNRGSTKALSGQRASLVAGRVQPFSVGPSPGIVPGWLPAWDFCAAFVPETVLGRADGALQGGVAVHPARGEGGPRQLSAELSCRRGVFPSGRPGARAGRGTLFGADRERRLRAPPPEKTRARSQPVRGARAWPAASRPGRRPRPHPRRHRRRRAGAAEREAARPCLALRGPEPRRGGECRCRPPAPCPGRRDPQQWGPRGDAARAPGALRPGTASRSRRSGP